MRASTESRRRSSMAPRRVSDSAVKSAVKPSRAPAAAPGSSVKSYLPRPSTASAARGGAASTGPRAQRSVAGPSARSRLTLAAPRLNAFTPQAAHRAPAASAATASKVAQPSRLSVDSQRRLSRGSGIGASQQRRADPRPVSDRSYWQPATHRVVQFLADRGFTENRPPVTYKDLVKCTGREFDDIFAFIYGFLHPGFTLAQKKRDEVVLAKMKMLGYPGQITKSHLITIGCMHSWPALVAVLDWMADVVNLAFGPPGDDTDPLLMLLPTVDKDGFPETDQRSHVLLKHSLQAYDRFLTNQERPVEEDAQELFEALTSLRTTDPAELRRIETENQRLRQERPDLARLQEQLDELVERQAAADTDARRLSEYVAGRREQQAERLKQLEWLQKDAQERVRLAELKREQLDALKVEISQQQMSAEDVAKIAQQRSEICKQIDDVKEEIEQMATESGEIQMEFARSQSQRQAAVRRLNSQLAPLQSQLPGGEALQLRLTGSESDQLKQLTEFGHIMEGVERAARQELEKLNSTLLQQERHAREARSRLEQARQEEFHASSRLKRLEEEDAADRRRLQQQHAALDARIVEVDEELSRINHELQQLDVGARRAQLEADIKRFKEETAEREKRLAQRSQKLAENAALALEFRRWMEEDNEQLVRSIAGLCAQADERMRRTMEQHRELLDSALQDTCK
ncbi:kinetochore protein NDC80 homolog [Amphibalanus amphitrite]|uniref:kinetochore protein NDC80 homolog n=1 Tax=Amphibalanus amphitrite TaxID=1232801 RepID=UPI001C91A098|nr:kinetochore protein NDC80 homolog [Amphibalanus amphitrite]